MGIVNVTPDSFYDGGRFADPGRAVEHGLALAGEGADILDIGGESSRPGSEPVSADEELRRVVPVIAGLRTRTAALISVDTTKLEVAEAALDAGADIVNDISASGLDPRILVLAARYGAGFVMMHMKGAPKTMQHEPHYDDAVAEIRAFLAGKIAAAQTYGLDMSCIVLDPGIGFGKRLEDNLVLINHLDAFATLGRPLLVGVSRKAFIGRILDAAPDDRLEGTIAAAVVSVVRGAHILRVHDVKAIGRAARVADAIVAGPPGPAPAEGEAGHVR
jgi:dihydropteroate synthase